MEKVAVDHVTKKISTYKKEGQKSETKTILEQYLDNPKLSSKDIVGMVTDLLLAGVHTTAFTTSFALFYIANNEKVQAKIYEELLKILPDHNDDISPGIINC